MSKYKTYLSRNDNELRKQERVGSAMWLPAAEAWENNMYKYIYLQVHSCIDNYHVPQHSPSTHILVRTLKRLCARKLEMQQHRRH